jgi:hypothetical protein
MATKAMKVTKPKRECTLALGIPMLAICVFALGYFGWLLYQGRVGFGFSMDPVGFISGAALAFLFSGIGIGLIVGRRVS